MTERRTWAKTPVDGLSIRARCRLLGVNRGQVYKRPRALSRALMDVSLINEINDLYATRPFLGYKRMTDALQDLGYAVNHKRVYRLMKQLGLQAIYPKRNLSKRRHEDAVFPYLLAKDRPQQPHDAWCVDITYIRTSNGYAYLCALIDVASRCVMGWHLSNTLDTHSCLQALEMALETGYTPKIINSDQGCQFTSQDWIWALAIKRIEISMDGKGRALDNIPIERFWRTLKYEEVYLRTYETMVEAKQALAAYMKWYNHGRRHSALEKRRPYDVMTGRETQRSVKVPNNQRIRQQTNLTKDNRLSSQIAA